jgi:hypothetical protein
MTLGVLPNKVVTEIQFKICSGSKKEILPTKMKQRYLFMTLQLKEIFYCTNNNRTQVIGAKLLMVECK